ncbi:hypothetical protein ES332_A06G203300v1 [Gossypium tomentosum]|uniref:Uncharacterized protein n=1 Tax=Gossypium tomentosum TaxID=34277 RepID=A0A5D2Q941_GOSTO|nr:hypothetical protein ES332_A06G203300v1 [Gossypium tomentosum]
MHFSKIVEILGCLFEGKGILGRRWRCRQPHQIILAEMADTHIVEVPGDEEHQHKLSCALTTITAIQNHPLMDLICY